jgi:hypothetical protein
LTADTRRRSYIAGTGWLALHSIPGAALAGKMSDLITTGTAPEFGSMVPMSM